MMINIQCTPPITNPSGTWHHLDGALSDDGLKITLGSEGTGLRLTYLPGYPMYYVKF